MLKYEVIDDKFHNIKEILLVYFQISNRLLTKLKKEQKIFLNGTTAYVTKKVSIGDIIEIDINFDEESENIIPVEINLNIIFEDEYMLIINKPANMPVHPSMLHFEDSLSNGVAYYFQKNNIKKKIRPVNRLDKDTSGIVIFAKNEYIQECLINQMKNNIFEKKYIAILEGILEKDFGSINAPIDRKENSIIERVISENGYPSITHFKLLKNFEINVNDFTTNLNNTEKNFGDSNNIKKLSLVEFKLETGRTHQIRVHSKYINHPILGDSLYGSSSNLISRQALHAYKVSFIHPITKENLEFETKLPNDMNILIS